MSRVLKAFCTTTEASSLLGVSVSTIQNWTESGLLASWKTEGGHRRIDRDSINRLLAQPQTYRAISHTQGKPARPEERLRILIVEDDPSLLRLYQIRMAAWSMSPEVEIAADGFEGLVKVGLQRPDLLISDLHMPHLDGFRMIASLCALPVRADMEIAVVTGLSPEDIAQQGGLPDGVRVFAKPLAYAGLEALAQQVYERKQQRRAAAATRPELSTGEPS